MSKKILIYDLNGKTRFLKEGDVVCAHSSVKFDVYKDTDKQVIFGKAKAGDAKRRYALILEIIDANNVIICCASSEATLKFVLINLTKNEKVKFSKRLITKVNPHTNILYKDTLVNFNVAEKQELIKKLKLTLEYKKALATFK